MSTITISMLSMDQYNYLSTQLHDVTDEVAVGMFTIKQIPMILHS
jgi:hypothetical protein